MLSFYRNADPINVTSFSGTVFPVRHSPNVTRIHAELPFSDEEEGKWGNLSYFRQDDLCILRGRIRILSDRAEDWRDLLVKLPTDCRPFGGNIAFARNQGHV